MIKFLKSTHNKATALMLTIVLNDAMVEIETLEATLNANRISGQSVPFTSLSPEYL